MEQSSRRIAYSARLDATPEAERATLSNMYSYVLSCANKKAKARGVSTSAGDDAKEGPKNDSSAKTRIL